MLRHLDWPRYMYDSGTYISRRDEKLVCRYLGTKTGDYEDLGYYQEGIRKRQLAARYKKITDVWDETMKQVPKLPKDWERWLLKKVISEHYIFYKYKKGGATEGYCTHCSRMVPIHDPRYNKKGICSKCGQEIQFKSIDKSGTIWTESKAAYLIQRYRKGIVLRLFEARMILGKGDFQNPEIWFYETKRIFYDDQFQEEPYYYGDFKNRGARWISGDNYFRRVGLFDYYPLLLHGKVYPRTLYVLGRRELKKTGLIQWIQKNPVLNPRKYLKAWEKFRY